MHSETRPPAVEYTGEVLVDMTNARGFSVGPARMQLTPDDVIVQHAGRALAVIDRAAFRAWLGGGMGQRLETDNATWSHEYGYTHMTAGTTVFRVDPLSLAALLDVL